MKRVGDIFHLENLFEYILSIYLYNNLYKPIFVPYIYYYEGFSYIFMKTLQSDPVIGNAILAS